MKISQSVPALLVNTFTPSKFFGTQEHIVVSESQNNSVNAIFGYSDDSDEEQFVETISQAVLYIVAPKFMFSKIYNKEYDLNEDVAFQVVHFLKNLEYSDEEIRTLHEKIVLNIDSLIFKSHNKVHLR